MKDDECAGSGPPSPQGRGLHFRRLAQRPALGGLRFPEGTIHRSPMNHQDTKAPSAVAQRSRSSVAAFSPRRALGGAENARIGGKAAGLESEPCATSLGVLVVKALSELLG